MSADFQYELFFELSPDLLCIAGYDGYFKKINPAVSKLLGYSMEELYARPINDFVYEDDKEITAKARAELTKANPLFNFENRYLTKGGEIVWLSWTSLPVDSDRQIFAIAKNITHKKKLEAERNSLLEHLTKANHDLKQLTFTTSHDLRSPVNNLLSVFGLIDTSRINDQETVAMIELLKLTGENLKETLNNYVDVLSERYSAHAATERIQFAPALQSVLQSITSLIETSGAKIAASFSEADSVRFNKAYLESLFLNLITNAIKYARPGVTPVISIYSEDGADVTRLVVADNGLGFDMEKVKDKLFGLHQKFHSHSDSKGIGLYLVHSHVTSMGGKIDVESKVNEGTKFTISFRK